MKETISNELVSVSVKHHGAELCSFWDKTDGVEHIWQAYPDVWARHAPILFPIVGKVEKGKLVAEGKAHEIGQHGFARDMVFEVVEKTKNSLLFELNSSSETKKKYPYDFKLQVKYTLEAKNLSVEYFVSNPSAKDIYFSIGAHPAFSCPFNEGESFEDYYLEFEEEETVDRLLLTDKGLRSGEVHEKYLADEAIIDLTESLFDEDAIIFENLKSTKVSIRSNEHDKSLTVDFTGFPLLGLWTKPKAGAPYVCIEPWYGVADEEGKGGKFTSKKAIQKLESNGSFACKQIYSIED